MKMRIPMTDATAAWTLIQIAALLRKADELLLTSIRMLGPSAHAGFEEDATLALQRDEVDAFRSLLIELADASDQLRVLGEILPETALQLDYDDLREGAAEDLGRGIAEPERACLAARVLPVADGWRALAEALRVSDVHADWHETTVAELLRRFRGADAELVDVALVEAGLDHETTFADIADDRLTTLATVLDSYAADPRR